MGAFQAMPGVIVTTSSAMKCCDGNCVRRWPLTSFAIRTHLYLYDKGKGVCVRNVCAIYDNNISPSLLMIIIKIIVLYFIQIRHTDAFPPTGTLLVTIMLHSNSLAVYDNSNVSIDVHDNILAVHYKGNSSFPDITFQNIV